MPGSTPTPDDRYRLRVLTRCLVAGTRFRPGDLLLAPPDKLRAVAHLVRCRTARPDDERTRLDVDLFEALLQALP